MKGTDRPKTLNSRLSVLSTLLTCAYEWKRIERLPCRIMMLRVDDEVPARTVQELARHASLSITMRYMHLSPNATEEGIAMLTQSRAEGGKTVAIRANGLPTTLQN